MKKILIVIGTRPEAIKMAPLIHEFKKNDALFETKLCVTGQHREMLDQVLNIFEISSDYDMNIMKKAQNLYDVSSKILLKMRPILLNFKPDLVFVHGDTTTTFFTALAAFYQQIPIAHVEAGLRTGNIYAPWPEEANRKLTTQITKYHFTPTQSSKENLLRENVNNQNIIVTGNTVIDALFLALKKIQNNRKLEQNILKHLSLFGYKLNTNKKIILVTGHRRENHGQGLLDICNALKEIAIENDDVDIVYPVHLNPNVQTAVKSVLSDVRNVYLIKPLQYEEFIYMMQKSYMIITDSGGIQEEAPSLGKPVLVLRETTERPEALETGTVKLVGTDSRVIIKETQELLDDKEKYAQMSISYNPFGNGSASENIVKYIKTKMN